MAHQAKSFWGRVNEIVRGPRKHDSEKARNYLRRAKGRKKDANGCGFPIVAINFWHIGMKLATYNVNGINGRLSGLLRWLQESKPDAVCLQELKCQQENFPLAAIESAGYGAIWHGQKSWNGVAILLRGRKPDETRRGLPGDPDDTHSRYIEAERRLTEFCLAASISPMVIRHQAPSSITSCAGSSDWRPMPKNSSLATSRSFSRETTTSSPWRSMRTSRSDGSATLCFFRSRERRIKGSYRKVGRTPFDTSIPTPRFIRFGISSAIPTLVMQESASIISC
jgi:hypothetical protein